MPTSRSPLRIAHVMHCLHTGGLEKLVVELATRTQSRDVSSLVIALGGDGPIRVPLERAGIRVDCFDDLPGLSSAMTLRLSSALRRFGAQVVHAHDRGQWLNSLLARALYPPARIVTTLHELRRPGALERQALRLAARGTFALVACGREVREGLETWAPPGTRRLTIPNGVPLHAQPTAEERRRARERLGVHGDAVVFGYVGRLHEEKGPDLLLRGFLTAFGRDPRRQLVLIGPGPLEPLLRAEARGFPNVRLLGDVPGASALLAGVDVYAQMSLREGRSLSMLEAMAAGLPTVAHALPAVRELHTPGETAVLVPLRDSAQLRDALLQLAADERLRSALGLAARRRATSFGIEATVDGYLALYREAAGLAAPVAASGDVKRSASR